MSFHIKALAIITMPIYLFKSTESIIQNFMFFHKAESLSKAKLSFFEMQSITNTS